MASPPHNTSLDGLRFLAFLGVFLFHTNLLPTGHCGVWVFFVLSGFLIGRILLKQQSSDTPLRERLRIFYIRRSLRIFPLYYVVLIGFAVWQVFHPGEFMPRELLWEACYLTNIWRFFNPQVDLSAHFWTLAIEEQFYILAPILILLLPIQKLARGYALYVGLNLVILVSLAVWYKGDFAHYPLSQYYLSSFYEFCVIGLGVRLAMLEQGYRTRWFHEQNLARIGKICLPIVLICSLPGISTRVMRYDFGWFNLFVAGASAWIILGLWQHRFPRLDAVLEWPPFVYLGKISYGLYVYHGIVIILVSRYFHHYRIAVPIEFCLTVVMACVSWHVLENPINNLKRYFGYRIEEPLLPLEPHSTISPTTATNVLR